jgi:hypothetical protein
MNESENPSRAMTDSENADLREEVQSLKFMLGFSLLMSFIFSLSVFFYMLSQSSSLHAQLAQEQQVLGNFENGGGAAQAVQLFGKLGEYARSHPDYGQQVFQKYSGLVKVQANPNAPKK